MSDHDPADLLALALYGRTALTSERLGGARAKVLEDAAQALDAARRRSDIMANALRDIVEIIDQVGSTGGFLARIRNTADAARTY